MAPHNAQPFYHRLSVLFTATSDTAEVANSEEFKVKLTLFLRRTLGRTVIASSVELDEPCEGEAGDPTDLM